MQNNPIIKNDPTGHKEIESGNCDAALKKSTPPCPKGTKDRRDLTDWMARALVDSAKNPGIKHIARLNKEKSLLSAVQANGEFTALVKNDAYFDVKWNVLDSVGHTIKLGNNWYEFSASGNIMYGFYGSAANFSPTALYQGAGAAQRFDDFLFSWGLSKHPEYHTNLGQLENPFYVDTEDDHYGVQVGIELYEQYQNTGTLTASDLAHALDTNPYKTKMNPQLSPSKCKPATSDYPTDAFYNK